MCAQRKLQKGKIRNLDVNFIGWLKNHFALQGFFSSTNIKYGPILEDTCKQSTTTSSHVKFVHYSAIQNIVEVCQFLTFCTAGFIGPGDNRASTQSSFTKITIRTWAHSKVFGFFRFFLMKIMYPRPNQF